MGRARSVEVVARERAPTIEAAAIACSARQARKLARGLRRGRRATPPWQRTRAGGPGEHLRAPRRRSAGASPARDLGCACWPPATLLLWVGAVKVEVAREVRARSRVHRSAPACGAKAETCADSETPEIPTETTTARRETHPRPPARAGRARACGGSPLARGTRRRLRGRGRAHRGRLGTSRRPHRRGAARRRTAGARVFPPRWATVIETLFHHGFQWQKPW